MTWVTWRQHRTQAIVCLALVCVIAVYAIAAGTWMRATFNDDGLPACLAHSGGADCPAAITSFVDKFSRNGINSIINLPLIGHLHAGGLTIDQLEQEVRNGLRKFVKNPDVVANIAEYHSQTISVIGAVNNPQAVSSTAATRRAV